MKQDGYINILGLLFCLLISSFFILQLLNKYQRNQEIKARAQVFLCAKEHSSFLRSYLKRMARLNQAILASYLLQRSPIPAVAAAAKAAHKTSVIAQYGVHVSFLKNQLTAKHCHWFQRSLWVKTQPYSNSPWLKRSSTGVAKLKEKKWSVRYPPQVKKLRPSRYFYLKSEFEVSSALSHKIQVEAKEVSWPLSSSYGSPSSLPSASHF